MPTESAESHTSAAASVATPVEAAEDAAEALADASAGVVEALGDATDTATGGLSGDAADALSRRVAEMEASLEAFRSQLAAVPGQAAVADAADELGDVESEVAEAAEGPVHLTVDAVSDVTPKRSWWWRSWPRWF